MDNSNLDRAIVMACAGLQSLISIFLLMVIIGNIPIEKGYAMGMVSSLAMLVSMERLRWSGAQVEIQALSNLLVTYFGSRCLWVSVRVRHVSTGGGGGRARFGFFSNSRLRYEWASGGIDVEAVTRRMSLGWPQPHRGGSLSGQFGVGSRVCFQPLGVCLQYARGARARDGSLPSGLVAS